MKLQDAKNEVARKYGFANWNALITLHCGGEYRDSYVEEAMKLYAKHQAMEFAQWASSLIESNFQSTGTWYTRKGFKSSEQLYDTFKNR